MFLSPRSILYDTLNAHGIEIPFPQQDVHLNWRQSKSVPTAGTLFENAEKTTSARSQNRNRADYSYGRYYDLEVVVDTEAQVVAVEVETEGVGKSP